MASTLNRQDLDGTPNRGYANPRDLIGDPYCWYKDPGWSASVLRNASMYLPTPELVDEHTSRLADFLLNGSASYATLHRAHLTRVAKDLLTGRHPASPFISEDTRARLTLFITIS